MGPSSARPLVLDAGALIAIERANRAVLALIAVAAAESQQIVVPAGVVGQVWRSGHRQARIARVIRARDTVVDVLDLSNAEAAGVLCGLAGTNDVVDASVVLSARKRDALVLTSDPEDMHRLDPALDIHRV